MKIDQGVMRKLKQAGEGDQIELTFVSPDPHEQLVREPTKRTLAGVGLMMNGVHLGDDNEAVSTKIRAAIENSTWGTGEPKITVTIGPGFSLELFLEQLTNDVVAIQVLEPKTA